jgi:RHS repeat-associated protein
VRAKYTPYGKPTLLDTGGNPVTPNEFSFPVLFTGQRYDIKTNLHYYKKRYLSASVGRFISQDTLGMSIALNLYILQRVPNVVDPFGEQPRRPGTGGSGDPQGQAIFEHWLGGDGRSLLMNDDPAWSQYMKSNSDIRSKTASEIFHDAYSRCKSKTSGKLNLQFHMELSDNGYETGYQLLHGTNATVGDFQMHGDATYINDENCCHIKYDMTYIWNDIIDPNPSYKLDVVLSALAEVYTLGKAEDYRILILWLAECEVIQHKDGTWEYKGWPLVP